MPVSKTRSKVAVDLEIPVSPASAGSLEDEVVALRARNKVLAEALKGVHDSASKAFKKNSDLVWFARNRSMFFVGCSAEKMFENNHGSHTLRPPLTTSSLP